MSMFRSEVEAIYLFILRLRCMQLGTYNLVYVLLYIAGSIQKQTIQYYVDFIVQILFQIKMCQTINHIGAYGILNAETRTLSREDIGHNIFFKQNIYKKKFKTIKRNSNNKKK